MSDKDNTTNVPQADAEAPQIAAANAGSVSSAGATATNINQIDVRVILQAPRSGGGQRAPRREPAPQATTPSRGASSPTGGQAARGNGIASAASRAPTSSTSSLEASGGHHNIGHVNGDERHILTDRDGSTVVIIRDSDTGDTRLTFDDTRARFTTRSDEAGFEGQRRLPNGYGGIRNVQMDVSPSATFNSATIYCQDNVSPLSFSQWGLPTFDRDTTTTTNQRVGQLTVREVQEFTQRNPELGAELRGMRFRDGTPVVVTEADGRDLTAAALNQLTPPRVQACPAGRDDEYVGVVPRR